MDDPDFQRDLDRTLGSEVLGERLFATAARLARRPDHREKWETLRDLEIQTRDRILAYLERESKHATPPRFTRAKATLFGTLFGLLPWRTAMKLLEDGTAPFLEIFERLDRHANPETKAFFESIVAHELAIADFARKERSGAADSLASVRALLDA